MRQGFSMLIVMPMKKTKNQASPKKQMNSVAKEQRYHYFQK